MSKWTVLPQLSQEKSRIDFLPRDFARGWQGPVGKKPPVLRAGPAAKMSVVGERRAVRSECRRQR
ncbi:hypothetical protein KL86PLE_30244 [uncultured Pleomorphomonas sp.]|uniref:Uncharacterized protein n=1 Tax=uncultured Pleomorphomonas sp. TaxID=442121 RepID=A0A212LE78_9HYPH|nr:hypothetical protein KL86PLE_30244 [uncultured Pleomorphomonas sp.]